MVYTLSYQMYKYEHGLSVAEQRDADVLAGERAAAGRAVRLRLGRVVRPRAGRAARRGADAAPGSAAGSMRLQSSRR
jgi:hypothetical protein